MPRAWFIAPVLLMSTAPGTVLAADAGAFIPTGDVADAPQGFVDMCRRDEALCTQIAGTATTLAGGGQAAPDASADRGGALPQRPLPTYAASDTSIGATGALRNGGTTPDCAASPIVAAEAIEPPASGFVHAAFASPAPVAPLRVDECRLYPALTRLPPRRDEGAEAAPQIDRPIAAIDLSAIKKINQQVNNRVSQVTDRDLYGVDEYWARPVGEGHMIGDCEDIAIEKRLRLLAVGVPAQDITFAVVYAAKQGLHTLLVVHLGTGDFVLDSLTSRIVRWDHTPYRWLRLEAWNDFRTWRKITVQS